MPWLIIVLLQSLKHALDMCQPINFRPLNTNEPILKVNNRLSAFGNACHFKVLSLYPIDFQNIAFNMPLYSLSDGENVQLV